jgi:aminoglycoside/choline kinase family phosphotransferase
VLLEDFGDARVRDWLDEHPADEEAIYARAVALLADLHRLPPADAPPYDRAAYNREVDLLTEWYCPAMGLEVDLPGYRAAWDAVLPLVEQDDAPRVTVLRDYHAENIMLLSRGGLNRTILACSIFRTRLSAIPPMISFRCCRMRAVMSSPELEAKMLDHYKALANPGAGFDAAYAVLGAQRNAKIIGIFTRLWKRDGKPRYLSFLPRMWGLLERDLAHPALAPVAEWFAANIPAEYALTGFRRRRSTPADSVGA